MGSRSQFRGAGAAFETAPGSAAEGPGPTCVRAIRRLRAISAAAAATRGHVRAAGYG